MATLRFIPSRIEGLPDVSEVAVFPDRIELTTAGRVVMHRFVNMARWPVPRLLWKLLYRAGVRPKWLPVADRDWFHDGPDLFFEFYTRPSLKVFMPRDEVREPYGSSWFVRIQNMIRQGGFETFDLG